jgi:hypothetical protein
MTFFATSGVKPTNTRRSAVRSSRGHVSATSSISQSGAERRAAAVFPTLTPKREPCSSTSPQLTQAQLERLDAASGELGAQALLKAVALRLADQAIEVRQARLHAAFACDLDVSEPAISTPLADGDSVARPVPHSHG